MRSESFRAAEKPGEKGPSAEPASGEVTSDNPVLLYRRIAPSDRNWRRDAAFRALPENERHAELVREAIRDTRLLSETLRYAVSDVKRRDKFRDMLLEIEFELQKDE